MSDNTAYTYPHPDHCSRFFECYNGCASERFCDQDFLYDDIHGWCDYPDRVSSLIYTLFCMFGI